MLARFVNCHYVLYPIANLLVGAIVLFLHLLAYKLYNFYFWFPPAVSIWLTSSSVCLQIFFHFCFFFIFLSLFLLLRSTNFTFDLFSCWVCWKIILRGRNLSNFKFFLPLHPEIGIYSKATSLMASFIFLKLLLH